MIEQPELDLPPAPTHHPAPGRRRLGFGGFSRQQLLLGALFLALIIWGMWVTRALTAPKRAQIVSARLSSLVGDYVEAQRYSGSPPERVQAEMRTFMASLDKELQRRSETGQVVLVGEAVLTQNVPDITDSLKKAVFAAGVPEPKRMSVQDVQRMQELGAAQASLAASGQQQGAPQGAIDPLAAARALQIPQRPAPVFQSPATRGAAVSTFGEPGGNNGQ
ncbi:MAG TPA: TrbI F-type domain-containing protein [Sphingobium sp.]|uniref:TrbI F-type domain-containing protein n=1 Tax=Sphingobium sp. TaxID=1912891 RepID=UPI002ECFBF48